MEQSFKTLKSALRKGVAKAINKALDGYKEGEELDQFLSRFYEYLIDEGDVDTLKSLLTCYAKGEPKKLVNFLDRYEDFDYPFHEEGKKASILVDPKVLKYLPDNLSWFYGYLFNTDSKWKRKVAEALKKRYKTSFPSQLKREATGEEMSDTDFLSFLDKQVGP